MGDYHRALAAGDVDALVAAFEPDGYAREPAGGRHVHRGHDRLRSFYGSLFSNGGGISLEHCAAIDDGHSCVLEYNVVQWGTTQLAPEAGVAVYARGPAGKLAAAAHLRRRRPTGVRVSPPGRQRPADCPPSMCRTSPVTNVARSR